MFCLLLFCAAVLCSDRRHYSAHAFVVAGVRPARFAIASNDARALRPARVCTPARAKVIAVLRSRCDDDEEEDDDDDDDEFETDVHSISQVISTVTSSPARSLAFSALMAASGAVLGPFLDSYHSAFGVLQYDDPITATLWGADEQHPAFITAWWVPELFGLAGFLIGWLYILLDAYFCTVPFRRNVGWPLTFMSIHMFALEYWNSGNFFHIGMDRTIIFFIISVHSAMSFTSTEGSRAGFWTSTAVALGGPLIEVGLLTLSKNDAFFHGTGYHYNDLGETGFFPLWIVPVYFAGGAANGNLARRYWTELSRALKVDDRPTGIVKQPEMRAGCKDCNDTRCASCPIW